MFFQKNFQVYITFFCSLKLQRFLISQRISSVFAVSKENDRLEETFLMADILGCSLYFSIRFVMGMTLVSLDVE